VSRKKRIAKRRYTRVRGQTSSSHSVSASPQTTRKTRTPEAAVNSALESVLNAENIAQQKRFVDMAKFCLPKGKRLEDVASLELLVMLEIPHD
jgi:hypothetical protein